MNNLYCIYNLVYVFLLLSSGLAAFSLKYCSLMPNIVKSMTAAIRTEFTIFQTTGVRGRCLQLAYSYLLSVPPASVEAERAFSAAGLLCTKIRSRMSDKSLDALCFLRSYYASSMRKVDDK